MRTRKFKKSRSPHKIFLVICEGETEEAYINQLKRYYRLPITIKTKVVGNSITSRLISQYLKELGVTKEDCSVFYVYDGDIKVVKERILSLEGKAIVSTPCIELWFLLHIKTCNKSLNSETIIKELCSSDQLWKNYSKGGLNNEQRHLLITNQEIAMTRAMKLKWPSNPSSNMYDFIIALENERDLVK